MRSLFVSICAIAVVIAAIGRPADAAVRTYYIAADEVLWNYAPSGKDVLMDKPLPPLAPLQLGWSFHKAVYDQYTDATFSHKVPRPAQDAYLGLIGPILHAEVGDTLIVHFKNNTRFALSLHPHGVEYKKNSEGAPYADGTPKSDKGDDGVAPGHQYTYTWQVPERAGPGPGDPSSIMWMFHSHTDEVRDVNTGPVGEIVVTRKGMARPDGTPMDVDRELFITFAQESEDQSRFYPVNLADPVLNPHHRKAAPPFQGDNSFFSINGFVYGNMPMPTIREGQRVRWYVMATMSDFDFHAPHWHGNTVVVNGMRTDLLQVFPMQMVVADMVPDDPGIWLIHCHVNLHLLGGMEARYQVLK